MIQSGDELLFISSKKFEERINWIINALECDKCLINQIILPDGIEEKWEQMIDLIKQNLSNDTTYIVNLTCGTKYMISAVPKAFENFDAEFYYIPFPKNIILKIGNERHKDILYRMSVKEFFDCNNTSIPKQKELTKCEDYTLSFFKLFTKGLIKYDVIEKIRIGYREKRIKIADIEIKADEEKKPQISGLSQFLSDIKFIPNEAGFLSKDETVYLTGGWFEEYSFSLLKKHFPEQDFALGVGLPIAKMKGINNRDLDVVFTFENKLFIIECKTGIDKESILSETVYKAAALKNERLGKLSANTFIFSLSGENEIFKEIAKAMNIVYYDRSFFTDEEKINLIITDINRRAKG
jgi:hypothetical protein